VAVKDLTLEVPAERAADRGLGEAAHGPVPGALPGDHRLRLHRGPTRSGSTGTNVYAIAFFGVVGYFLLKVGCEPAPLLLGFVLGPLLEEHLRRAMIISRGDPSIFFTRPISLALLIGAAIALVAAVLPGIREKREEVF
jgi:hypothetical protein